MTNPDDSSALDCAVRALRPGESLEVGRAGDVRTLVERSGDGRWLRWVRENGRGFVVFHREPVAGGAR